MDVTNNLISELEGVTSKDIGKAKTGPTSTHNTSFPTVEGKDIENSELPDPSEQGITNLKLTEDNKYLFKSRNNKEDGKEQWHPISNFTFRSRYLLKNEAIPKRVLELKNIYGEMSTICIPTEDLTRKNKFEAACESEGNFVLSASGPQFNRIKEYVFCYEKQAQGIDTLGFCPEGKLWAFADAIFDGKKVYKANEDGVVAINNQLYYLPAFSRINKNADTEYRNERKMRFQPGRATFREFAHQLTMVFGNNAMVGIAFFLAAVFRDIVFTRANCFPLLFLFGPKGTGKTTFRQFLMRPFGDYGPSDAISLTSASSPKGFSRKLSQVFNGVVAFEEYKNSIHSSLIEMQKNAYDGIGYERAQTSNDNKTHATAVNSAVIIGGQEMPTKENALFSRTVLLNFSKAEFEISEKEEFRILEEMMGDGLGNVLLEILQYRHIMEKEFSSSFDRTYDRLRADHDTSSLEERTLTNISAFLAPFDVLAKRIDMPFSIDGKDGLFSVLKDNAIEQQKQIHGTNEVNEFWQIFNFLVIEGRLNRFFDYDVKNSCLWIYYAAVYEKYNELAMKQNLNRLDKLTLRSYLTMGKCFAADQCDPGRTDTRVSMKNGQKRVMPFKIEGILAELDCLQSDFDKNQNDEK